MTIILNDEALRIVAGFSIPLSKNAVSNYFQNTLLPLIEAEVVTKLQNNFTNFSVKRSYDLQETSQGFQAIARIRISGTTELTAQQLINGVNNTLDDIKVLMKAQLIANGGTPLYWHIHDSTGSLDQVE